LRKQCHFIKILKHFQVFDFELTKDDMKEIESFHRPWRACLPKITVR